jgi:hypothetical protein
VFGLYRDAAELTGFVTREEKDSSRSLCVPFEHPAYLRDGSLALCCIEDFCFVL